MKNVVTPMLLIGILFSASFGLIMMNHADGMSHGQCPFEAVGVTDCSKVQSTIDFLNSHLKALANFFSTASVNSFTNLISIFALLALAILLTFNKSEVFDVKPLFVKNRFRESFVPPQRALFNYWFSLHENSPAYPKGRW